MKSAGFLCAAIFIFYGSAHAIGWSREGEFLIDTNVVNTNSQCNPAVAFDGTNYLVVWEDDRNGAWDIYGARVDQSGNVIDPIAIPLSIEPNDQRNPAICFCGADYLIVWSDTRNDSLGDIYGARINQAGVVLDPMGIAISAAVYGQKSPSIAFDGTNYLVVWQDSRNDTIYNLEPDIYGARVSQTGIVLDIEGIGIEVDTVDPIWTFRDYNPSLCFGGSQYLVVWPYIGGLMPDHMDIYAKRIDPSGAVLDTTVIHLTDRNYSYRTQVAFDGTNYLAVYPYACGVGGIGGARVSQGGEVLDPAGIIIDSMTNRICYHPSVAFDGIYYVVTWQDSLNADYNIHGAELNTSGIPIDTFTVSSASGNQITPTIAHGSSNHMLITYSGWTDSVGGQPVNTMRIWGKFYPFIGIDEGKTHIVEQRNLTATIFRGPLQLPEDKACRVFDITGRVVEPTNITPGIYFLEVDNKIVQKVLKVR